MVYDTGFNLVAQIKSSSFAEEKEWRIGHLSMAGNPDVGFRQGTFGVTPYVAIDASRVYAKLPLAEIVVGPGTDYDIRERAVGHYLKHNGYDFDSITIKRSSIPFRAI